ncbi:hypothetical protein GIB67_029127 [Kingdonia uniflora]|uniref:GATA-type domain-containing protein n=1 Tax=Kingdonia uniflora TaxID=39325 RepID=A0A7J7NDL6_9MAGN|nr:hypothetical protein GIB67_029127 [Kingdonia uniflora]
MHHPPQPHNDTGTPLWRSGPFEKPILCNACGSRYRSRGTLANYTPKAYVRALAPLQSNNNRNFRDYKVQTAKKPTNWQIRKVHSEESIEDKVAVSPYYSCPSGFQDGTSNGSSSGSASSVSGSHIQLESMDWNAAGYPHNIENYFITNLLIVQVRFFTY